MVCKVKMTTKNISILCVLMILSFTVCECKAQESDFRIVADPYQYENHVFTPWTNDMVRIGITTKERGLIFKIVISNEQTDSVEIEDLEIDVTIKYGDETYSTLQKQITINYIYLPQDEQYEVIIPVKFRSSDDVGSYTTELTYTHRYHGSEAIEPYPFTFRLVSEEQFQKEIEQKKTGPLIVIGPFEIKLFDFGITITIISIPVVVVALYYWKKRKE